MLKRYIEYGDINRIMKESIIKNNKPLSFHDAINQAVLQKKYSSSKNKVLKRTNLTEDEFIDCIYKGQIYISTSSTTNSDSHLIPDDLDVFSVKQLTYMEQTIHPHNCFDIQFIYKGMACMLFEDEVKLLEEGDICIVSPNSRYRLYSEDDNSIIITIYIRNSSFESLFFDSFNDDDLISLFIRNVLYNNDHQSNYLLFNSTNNTDEIKELIQKIYIEVQYKDKYSNKCVINYTHILFITILRDFNFSHSYNTVLNKKNEQFIEIINYVQKNYQTVSIKDLSLKFHYNESYLSTLFVNYLGTNFTTIISNLKINNAKILLKETQLSINEISDIVGYNNVDNFSKMFKKHTSLSPSYYRKKHKV